MKKSIKKIIGITLISSLLLGTVGPVFASNTDYPSQQNPAYTNQFVNGASVNHVSSGLG
ncbi:hypothetical protein [Fangia hongkongensis]|uniref:hypothetical protein n=1 Tax=Fangia hongkongensis TaxID=270495 RepID=UPI000378FC1A|nr:hypothetical protein [Fangia hongkongensis]MBK2125783.1 hypothetical protein [Fangia hongkongensis]